ncbi:PIN domain [Bifidobacterium leontopitheci]|uniref:PIN domain n=2 Tax=Bifidobacterium leontopitheci TaxID=2650774 RepID=A0A6I1GRD0_9BIFI|nr:PIN domain [Bifidobacterium leontopitheci]
MQSIPPAQRLSRPLAHHPLRNLPTSVFLDTNVLLDHLMQRDGESGAATALLKTCVRHDIPLRCAATTLKDIAYVAEATLRRELAAKGRAEQADASSRDGAERSPLERETIRCLIRRMPWHCVEQTRALCDIVAIDQETCDQAFSLRNRHDDFEDDLIVAAALRSGSDYLATSDKRLIDHFPELCATPRRLVEMVDGKGA